MKSFKLFVEQSSNFSIGFFPGAFKPPHKGHFQTALQASKQNDSVAIIVSGSERDGISTDKAFQVWNVYRKYLPNNVNIFNVAGSPVTTIYQIVDIITMVSLHLQQKFLPQHLTQKIFLKFILK